jgi:predicted SprT family Zn-dependent metalloprotease
MYNKPKTEQELVNLFREIALNEFKWKCDIPVHVNTRLYRALGRYKYRVNKDRSETPTGFEFNSGLLSEEYPLESLVNVIKHELVHWLTDKEQGKPCSHNDFFIKNCEKFGVTDYTDFERYKPRKRLEKNQCYEAKCCGCNRIVAKAKNMSNLKKYMNRCGGTICSCKNGKRYIIDKGDKYIYNHSMNFFGYQKDEEWLDDVAEIYKVTLCRE